MIGLRELLENVINDVTTTIKVKSITSITGGYRLNICDTSYLRKGKTVTISGTNYIINNFRINEYIEILTTDVINITEFEAYPLHFFSGTLKDTNLERNGKKQVADNVVPFSWFVEPYEQRDNETFTGSISTNVDLTFYILDTCFPIGSSNGGNDLAWMTFDHHKQVIEPMQNWVENRLIPYIKYRVDLFGDLTDKVVTGLVFAMQSQNSTLFDENLSGVEVRMNLPIYSDENGCCVQTPFKTCAPVSIYKNDEFEKFVPSAGRFDYSTASCNPATVQLNGTEVGTIESGETKSFPVLQDGLPTGSLIGSNWVIPSCPVTPQLGAPPTRTGQTEVYVANDDGATQRGRDTDFFNTSYTNYFNNNKRFTGLTGGYQDELDNLYYDKDGNLSDRATQFPEEIVLDWTTWRGNQVYSYLISQFSNFTERRIFNDWNMNAPYNTTSWNGFYVANENEGITVMDKSNAQMMNYPPFNWIVFNNSFSYLWLSTTRPEFTDGAKIITQIGLGALAKTQLARALLVRIFNTSEL